MITKKVTYEDFDGNERTETLHFNLTKSELSRIVLEETTFTEGEDNTSSAMRFSEKLREIGRSGDGKKIVEMFEWLFRISYGEKSEDGRRFVKSPEVYENWRWSASYDQFWTDMLTGETSNMVEFINGVLPKDIAEQAADDPEFQRHMKELEERNK